VFPGVYSVCALANKAGVCALAGQLAEANAFEVYSQVVDS